MFLRRLTPTLHGAGASCASLDACPDILEMESGDWAIIGTDITAEAKVRLLPGSGCGPDERVVRIPRDVLIAAKPYIPDRE